MAKLNLFRSFIVANIACIAYIAFQHDGSSIKDARGLITKPLLVSHDELLMKNGAVIFVFDQDQIHFAAGHSANGRTALAGVVIRQQKPHAVTAQLNSVGAVNWIHMLHDCPNSAMLGVAIDRTTNDIYACGVKPSTSSTMFDLLLQKFTSTGTLVAEVRREMKFVRNPTCFIQVQADSSAIFVATSGVTNATVTTYAAAFMKVSSDLKQVVWTKTPKSLPEGPQPSTNVTGLALGLNPGEIYVAGYVQYLQANKTDASFFIERYNLTGDREWARHIPRPRNPVVTRWKDDAMNVGKIAMNPLTGGIEWMHGVVFPNNSASPMKAPVECISDFVIDHRTGERVYCGYTCDCKPEDVEFDLFKQEYNCTTDVWRRSYDMEDAGEQCEFLTLSGGKVFAFGTMYGTVKTGESMTDLLVITSLKTGAGFGDLDDPTTTTTSPTPKPTGPPLGPKDIPDSTERLSLSMISLLAAVFFAVFFNSQ
jgi:hypothetical protein